MLDDLWCAFWLVHVVLLHAYFNSATLIDESVHWIHLAFIFEDDEDCVVQQLLCDPDHFGLGLLEALHNSVLHCLCFSFSDHDSQSHLLILGR